MDDQGILYGMTYRGGAGGSGVIYILTPGSISPSYVNVNVANTSAAFGQTITLHAVLRHPADDTVLTGRTLQFFVNNVFLGTAVTDSNGIASYNYTVPDSLPLGPQTIKVVRLSNAQYNGSAGYATLNITPADTSVIVANVSGAIGQTIALSAVLRRTSDNAVLPGRTLLFYVGSVYIGPAICDNTGTAFINYKVPDGFVPGAQTIKVVRLSNSQYNGSTGTGTLTVTAADTSVTVADVSGQAGQTVSLSAVLRRTSDNTVLPGRTLLFYVSNTFLGSANCDSTGTAHLNYTIPTTLSAGTQQTITIKRPANSQYKASQGSGTLTVTP